MHAGKPRCPACLGLVLSACVLLASSTPGFGQRRLDVEAYVGRPFGVGRFTVPLRRGSMNTFEANGFALIERDGRVVYPAFTSGRVVRVIGRFLGGDESRSTPSALTVLFLFEGNEPMQLTLYTPETHKVTLTPRADARRHTRLLRQWWREYNALARDRHREGDYPAIVETYLTTMLSSRLRLKPPLLGRLAEPTRDPSELSIKLLLGSEELQNEVMRETLQGRRDDGIADQPLPSAIDWAPLAVPEPVNEVPIEPIARHVPEECFYVRFGRFSNYLWLSHLLSEHGGDLSQMVRLRAHDLGLNERIQKQLALKESVLGEIFGDQVIRDVAMIGRDAFMSEGAAMGMLFQAHNNLLLKNDFNGKREEALAKEKENGATQTIVKIDGRDVSFLSTPDNRLRSFYAIDGDYHLVTNSREIVRRFFEAGAGRRSLSDSDDFRYGRSLMPISRQDTIFVYMSPAFFQDLVSPQYRIELRRRLQAITDIELIQLAQLAARVEGKRADSIGDLLRNGILPQGFGTRPDGSALVRKGVSIIDSLRGARGTFLPIPDVQLDQVTSSEIAEYASLVASLRASWQQMDPLMIGIKRFALDQKDRERIVVDAMMTPFRAEKYGWIASKVGPPLKERVTPAPGDVVTLQASLDGSRINPQLGAHHVFVAVKDAAPLVDATRGGILTTLRLLRTTPGYLGAWPHPGYLDMLPLGLAPPVDPNGYSKLIFGLWRRLYQGFAVLSFDRSILEVDVPQLRVADTDNPAQFRIHVSDLSKTKLYGWSNAMAYMRAREASYGNTRLLHSLSQQLGVPRQEALATAERLLNVKLACTLGGQFKLVQHPSGLEEWVSTEWETDRSRTDFAVPQDHVAPLMQWFRGLDADLTLQTARLFAHVELEMQRQEPKTGSKIELPLLKLFKSKKPTAPQKPDVEELPEPLQK